MVCKAVAACPCYGMKDLEPGGIKLPNRSAGKKLHPIYWSLFAGAILLTDYMSGSLVNLAVLLFFPVALASWFNGRGWGVALAIITPLVQWAFHFVWTTPFTLADATINTVVRVVTFSIFAIPIDLAARQRAEIHTLKGILPTCAWCKQIRDADGQWHPIKTYISERSEAAFSHSICPECSKKFSADYVDHEECRRSVS